MSEDENTTSKSSDKFSQITDFTTPPIEPQANPAHLNEIKNKEQV